MRKGLVLLVIAVLFTAAFPAGTTFAQTKPTKTIADIVVESAGAKDKPEFTVLLAAVKAADPMFLEMLSSKDETMTVFAPTDAAFTALLKALNLKAEDLLKNTALLNVVLAYHVVPGAAFDAKTVTAAKGAVVGTHLPEHVLAIDVVGGKVKINKSTVVKADVLAVNGIVHVIDTVLVPDDAMELAKAVSDMMAATPAATADAMAAKPMSIAETVVGAASAKDKPEFTVLLAAVKAADPAVLKALSSDGMYTVFAPTDAAFGAAIKALKTTPEKLLADKGLTGILLYHVVPGEISAKTLVAAIGKTGVKVVTLSGKILSFNLKDGKVSINGTSTVVATDLEATNGIIHVIDGVLLPPAK
jgi:transforming growth factor-beta-induced protein